MISSALQMMIPASFEHTYTIVLYNYVTNYRIMYSTYTDDHSIVMSIEQYKSIKIIPFGNINQTTGRILLNLRHASALYTTQHASLRAPFFTPPFNTRL